MQRVKRLAIFGDSILKGVQLQQQTRRYCVSDALALEPLGSEYGISIDNRSRFGFTIGRGEQLVLRQLAGGMEADTALIEYGGNDADFHWDEIAKNPDGEHLPNTPLPQFVERLSSLVDRLRAAGVRPVLTTLPPISSTRYLDWITRDGLSRESILQWLGDEGAIYRFQERYSDAIKSLAQEKNVTLIDLRDAFLAQRKLLPFLCEDGIHPNTAGQRLIHDTFAAKLAAVAGK